MVAQARDLIAQGGGSDAILVAGPISPAFPGIATGPTGHDQNAQFVGFFEQFIAIESAFEAQFRGVEIRRAHLIGPPDSGMSKLELWELIRREFDDLGFAAG